ncbi:succinylglutamate desuccinylase/aspartoacylase family protein [Haliea sp.]
MKLLDVCGIAIGNTQCQVIWSLLAVITDFTASPREGLRFGTIGFDHPVLRGHTCPLIEIGSLRPGPHLCIMAGVHINEASSIQAATVLANLIETDHLRGSISIIPAVSTHNLYKYTLVTPPSEGRDLHWSYPGAPNGSFNDALAYSLVCEWAENANVLLDLHGGDMDEQMTRYVVVQHTGDEALDKRIMDVAACFETELVVALAHESMGKPGRCCTALGSIGKVGLVAEAGDFGMTDQASVKWHQNGILAVARLLGMLDGESKRPARQISLDSYEWIEAPASGIIEKDFAPGDWVEAGMNIGTVRDFYGRKKADIKAPQSGYIMMRKSSHVAREGYWIGSIAFSKSRP